MTGACVLVISMVCFHERVTVQHEDWGLGRSDTVVAKDYSAKTIEGDNFFTPNWREMSEGCTVEFCIRYHKHCVETAEQISCQYSYGRAGDLFVRYLTVTAAAADKFALAERDITFLSTPTPDSFQLPPGAMGVSSTAEDVPHCPRPRHVEPPPDCRP